MAESSEKTIVITDIVGYSALTFENEALALEILKDHNDLIRSIVRNHEGIERKQMGDGFLLEFSSPETAVRCALDIQCSLEERNAVLPEDHGIWVRIGIHTGEASIIEGDIFGHAVNMAARCEPHAPPGGLCVSEEVVRHLPTDEFAWESMGFKNLKNIPHPVKLFVLQSPTAGRSPEVSGHCDPKKPLMNLRSSFTRFLYRIRSARFPTLSTLALSLLIVGGSAALLTTLVDAVPDGERAGSRTDLRGGWTYATPQAAATSDQVQALSQEAWKPFDEAAVWDHAGTLEGTYWLQNSFSLSRDVVPEKPAFVLGLIPGTHETYLNGHYVGGSDRFSDLLVYSFDRSLLRTSRENQILVKVTSKPSLNAGIMYVPEVGMFVGEEPAVRAEVRSNTLRFRTMRYIYLAFSIVFMLSCFLYYAFHTDKKQFLYFGLYLLVSSGLMAYYTPFVADFADYHLQRLLKLSATAGASLLLCSAFFYLRAKPTLEAINNWIALGALTVCGFLLYDTSGIESFIATYDGLTRGFARYTAVWSVAGALILASDTRKMRRRERRMSFQFVYAAACMFSGAFLFLFLYSSAQAGFGILDLPADIHVVIRDLGTLFPILLTLAITCLLLSEHRFYRQRLQYTRRRDRLLIEIGRLVAESRDQDHGLQTALGKICRFIGASRATLYVARGEGSDASVTLEASHVYGSDDVNRAVAKTLDPTRGPIGYVLENRRPVIVHDIHSDPRFRHTKTKGEATTYKTDGFMLLPLFFLGEPVAVLTLADKVDGRRFTSHDFSLMQVMSKDLAMMLGTTAVAKSLPMPPSAQSRPLTDSA